METPLRIVAKVKRVHLCQRLTTMPAYNESSINGNNDYEHIPARDEKSSVIRQP